MDTDGPYSQSRQVLPSYLHDSGQGAMFSPFDNLSDIQLEDQSPIFDWNALEYCPSGISDEEQINCVAADVSQAPGAPSLLDPSPEALQTPNIPMYPGIDATRAQDLQLTQNGYTSLQQWLEGTYRPPAPCSYCRRHRLQCLTIRTSSVNPNPIPACSTCVALFRECSLSRGEKREPSGFETLSPVMGHLHGVTEHPEDGSVGISNTENLETRKESKQFVRKGARVLREWFHQNQEYPYPSEEEKLHFSRETGFSSRRISTWFANARRRQKQKLHTSTPPQVIRADSPAPTKLESMTPMERWQASPPEDEPVPESTIQNAIATGPMESNVSDQPWIDTAGMDHWNPEDMSSQFTSSACSLGSRMSDASASSESALSARSYQSGEPLPFPLLPRRPSTRRRRRRRQQGDEENQYQCTFCTQSFKRKHEWYRHEKSIHLPLESWVCTPDLNELQLPGLLPFGCRFCEAPFPVDAHWDEHEFLICARKPVQDRSFSRKDHLLQHLRKFHGCTKVPEIETWRKEANIHSRCGFCGSSLPTWRERADHLTDHFKAGFSMHQWVGDWGLDSSAMSVLRNAILPSERLSSHLSH